MTELAPLKISRKWHAMTWVEENPAAIGGERNGNVLNSVEMFENNSWVEICPLNISRSSYSGISIRNTV